MSESWESELPAATPANAGFAFNAGATEFRPGGFTAVSPATSVASVVTNSAAQAAPTPVVNPRADTPSYSSPLSQSPQDSLALKADEEEVVVKPPKNAVDPDPRPHLNIVFIGHVDAGKSTTCGNILLQSGQVDSRTIEKYEREAKEKNRESWFLAFIMDVNEEERQKGKTVEVGRAAFDLPQLRFTILDAPGHKSFVPNMISGASQADVAVLIISARKGEFETGFERGGQTREHAMLAKTLGVNQIIVAVNKMDESTCQWNEERFLEIETKLVPFLKSSGFNPAKDVFFIPISGLAAQNIKEHVSDPKSNVYDSRASWYGIEKPTLFQMLDGLKLPERSESDALRIPLLEGYRDQGVVAVGKVESGIVRGNQVAILMPSRVKVRVLGVALSTGDGEGDEVTYARPGENVTLRLLGVEETQITKGSVLSSLSDPCPAVTTFKAQVMVVELLEHRPIMSAGYYCILHAHTLCEEVMVEAILDSTDKTTKQKKLKPRFVKANCMATMVLRVNSLICVEPFQVRSQLGRFTLRDEGKTIAIGKVMELMD